MYRTDKKTFAEINQKIQDTYYEEFEKGRITRGFVTKERAKYIRTLLDESYRLEKANIRNFRDFTVLEHEFSHGEKYNRLASDCMSATVAVMDNMLINLGEEV